MEHPNSAAALAYFDALFPLDTFERGAHEADDSSPEICSRDAPRSQTQKYFDVNVHLPPKLPHPIPYQGSKRALAPLISQYVPTRIQTWYEPFAGSAAMTIWAAHHSLAKTYVIGDALPSMCALWSAIIENPETTARRYNDIWKGQLAAGDDYFNGVRDRYNREHDPVDLLYLICRCVKNAVRFNRHGRFTQSHDKRRLGMKPEKMEAAINGVSYLLRGRTDVRCGDWLSTTRDATDADFIYLDPPYLGTTIGRDKRYAEQLELDRLISGLANMRGRALRFVLSYDGMTGDKTYGEPLPDELELTRLLLHAGKSTQATLAGRSEDTVESLYLSPGLARPVIGIIRRHRPEQVRLFA